jgi:hypothetical protein
VRRINLIMGIALLGLSACSTVTIAPQGEAKLASKPSYEESKPFYFWGLSGEHHINVLEVCNNKEPLQMQSQQTFSDGLFGLITLGIYAPHTAKVWCPKETSE